MAKPILSTKLYIPTLRENVVFRPHLVERLNEGLRRKLTLISAPAGFGKTTLLGEWVAGCGYPIAWLSLDEGDNDPASFWSYVIAALQTLFPNIGIEILDALQSSQPPPFETILASLINEISALPDEFIFILDDYHIVDSKTIDGELRFLIERLPLQMHLAIATREDPDLPLPRLRARDQLVELRVKELRFTESEAAEFLKRSMGLHLSAEDIAALEARTEGWIVGLQMAALSMQGLEDTAGFIRSFTGSHHFVLDYLLEEVLHNQTENIQTFLLQTSILERICGDLCDAVLHDPSISGQETIEYLEWANLFIIPLDDERQWYRYHHLFAELLRSRLTRKHPDQIAELRRRASDWYANNNFPFEAITHALAIQDWPRAAEAIERFSDQLPMHGERNTRLSWLETIPAQFLLDRPGLGLVYAWTLFMSNQIDRAEQQLDQLTPFVQTTPAFLGEHYVIRVMIATRRYDLPAVIELAQEALSHVSAEEALPRSRILLALGVVYDEMGGDITAARNAFREAYELGKASPSPSSVGNAPLPLIALAYLSDYESIRGNLHDASRMYEQAIELVRHWGGQTSLALFFVQQGKASLLYEWNELDGAMRALQECFRINEFWKSPRLLVPACGLSALVMQARGQTEEANALIQRAEQATRDTYSLPNDMGVLAVYQISLWTMQNDFQAIAQWEQSHNSEWRSHTGRASHTLPIVLAYAHITRYYRQRDASALGRARELIEPAMEKAQNSGLMFNVMRLFLVKALAFHAMKETASALTTVKQALIIAAPENYLRSFLDLGKPMEELLSWSLESHSLAEPHLRAYVSKLLSHFGQDFSIRSSQPSGGMLIEPLSQRELEVLRLIANGLSNREISERLFLALSTVKGHTRVIFDKLQVQRRTEAVVRARELGLL